MKRITVPEPKIELYKDGFNKQNGDPLDMLEREQTGRKLSELVERIDEPLVIALDGAWGSGKSFFLKCWVGYHKQHKAETTTVYFDAFKHDFLDDPLIALTAEISDRLEREPESAGARAWHMAKNAAPFLAKSALRLGIMATVGAAVSLTGEEDGSLNDIGDNMAGEGGAISKELINFWKKEDGKRAAMEQFRSALIQLTNPNEADEPQKKLVIVVDELDRCRPDYALQLLEIIKHFFNVPGVQFVLGVNLAELQNSVRARYGTEVDAKTYLQKFINLNFALPEGMDISNSEEVWASYFDTQVKAMGLEQTWGEVLVQVKWMLRCVRPTNSRDQERRLSLRDIDRLLPILALGTGDIRGLPAGTSLILASLAIAKGIDPLFYLELRSPRNASSTFHRLFSLRSISKEETRDYYASLISYAYTEPQRRTGEDEFIRKAFGTFGLDGHARARLFNSLAEEYLETFSIPGR